VGASAEKWALIASMLIGEPGESAGVGLAVFITAVGAMGVLGWFTGVVEADRAPGVATGEGGAAVFMTMEGTTGVEPGAGVGVADGAAGVRAAD
jgi:hypothetical protein